MLFPTSLLCHLPLSVRPVDDGQTKSPAACTTSLNHTRRLPGPPAPSLRRRIPNHNCSYPQPLTDHAGNPSFGHTKDLEKSPSSRYTLVRPRPYKKRQQHRHRYHLREHLEEKKKDNNKQV